MSKSAQRAALSTLSTFCHARLEFLGTMRFRLDDSFVRRSKMIPEKLFITMTDIQKINDRQNLLRTFLLLFFYVEDQEPLDKPLRSGSSYDQS